MGECLFHWLPLVYCVIFKIISIIYIQMGILLMMLTVWNIVFLHLSMYEVGCVGINRRFLWRSYWPYRRFWQECFEAIISDSINNGGNTCWKWFLSDMNGVCGNSDNQNVLRQKSLVLVCQGAWLSQVHNAEFPAEPGWPGDLNFICPGPEIAWNLSHKVRKLEF